MPQINSEKFKMKLEHNVIRAIKYAEKEAKRLASAHPEIADEFKRGRYYIDIAKDYVSDFEISPNTSMNLIRYTLIELLGKEEVTKIAREHRIKSSKINGKKVGLLAFQNGTACFNISPEKRSEISRKVAKKMSKKYAKKNYKAGLGIAGMNKEERIATTKKGLEALGYVSSDAMRLELYCGYFNEREYVVHLKEREELSWKAITRQVNTSFGNDKSLESLRTCYNSYWRTKNPLRINNPPTKTPSKL